MLRLHFIAVLLLLPTLFFAQGNPGRPDAVGWIVVYDAAGHQRAEYCAFKAWLDASGDLKKIERYSENGSLIQRGKFGPGNRIVQRTEFSEDRSIFTRDQYRYGAGNRLVQVDHWDGEGNLIGTTEQEFNEQGQLLTKKLRQATGEVSETHAFTYREDKYAQGVAADGAQHYVRFDARGCIVEWQGRAAADSGPKHYRVTYDARGRLVEERFYHPNHKLLSEMKVDYPD
ncbi:MAG: hypothetical protein AAGN35_23295 [Bacteroidota bacterium]